MTKFMAVMDCSFCGKPPSKVHSMIAGPKVFICNECVDLCTNIVAEQRVLQNMKERGEIFVTKADADRLAWMKTWTSQPPSHKEDSHGE